MLSFIPFLISKTLIKPISVSLLNGISILIELVGSIQLTNSLCLNDVLFVPSFSYNLLLVSAIINQFPFDVNFTISSCSIQDYEQGKLIGMARRVGMLYV